MDKLDDNWEELTVEGFRGIATGIVSALGKIDEVCRGSLVIVENSKNVIVATSIKQAVCITVKILNIGTCMSEQIV